jgi:outer membrane lipoprotein SlyB
MHKFVRTPAIVISSVSLALLTACASTGPYSSTYPTSSYPVTSAPMGSEYGRIVSIEYMPAGTSMGSNQGILGAVVGGVAGALLGSQIGGGSGRTAATVLGGVAGAAVGNQVARNQQGVTTSPGYRITMQSDNGATRTYEVPATGDLRVGDRVRVDNGVIYRA